MCGLDRNFTTCWIIGQTFTVGQTTLKDASNKVVKHVKACTDNQHAFIPLSVS